MSSQAQEEAEERLRLLYVACTRAMDLLVLRALSWSANASWARTVDLRLDQVAGLSQSEIGRAFARIRWIRPSDADPDLVTFEGPGATACDQPVEPISVQGVGTARGIVLHKIMEELVTGEIEASADAIRQRLCCS